jgi:hypothetical protein
MRMVNFTPPPSFPLEKTPAHIKFEDPVFSGPPPPPANIFTTLSMCTYRIFFTITLVAHYGPDMQTSYV